MVTSRPVRTGRVAIKLSFLVWLILELQYILFHSADQQSLEAEAQKEQRQAEEFVSPPFRPTEAELTVATPSSCQGKQELLDILMRAKVPVENVTETCSDLPTWTEVVHLYGSSPVVVGMETCASYRSSLGDDRKAQPRVAGLYNSGTNALARLLALNLGQIADVPMDSDDNASLYVCLLGEKGFVARDILMIANTIVFLVCTVREVPWGKHVPLSLAFNQTKAETSFSPTILPIIIVRDPYWWAQSMCRSRYLAKWKRFKGRCPNFVPTERERLAFPGVAESFPVRIPYNSNQTRSRHDSLAHLWTDYNQQYLDWSDRPRLIIRFEDMLFRMEEVMDRIHRCTTGLALNKETTRYQLLKAKNHGSTTTDFVGAMKKYGSSRGRTNGMLDADLRFAKQHFNERLLKRFHYKYPI